MHKKIRFKEKNYLLKT